MKEKKLPENMLKQQNLIMFLREGYMMTNMGKFKAFVENKSHEWEGTHIDDIYFSQTRDRYYADYKPCYPEKSNADFYIVWDGKSKECKMYGNLQALIPTIESLEIL